MLVVGQLVVALVLLTGSGLLLRSFDKLRKVDLGFRTDHLLTAVFRPATQAIFHAGIRRCLQRPLLRRLRQLPGVKAVGITNMLPAAGQDSGGAMFAEGYVPPRARRSARCGAAR